MPTKKQRRRRAKERRHEWEEVWVDEEGRELPVEEAEPAAAAPKRDDGKPERKPAPKRGGRAARTVPPPSWRRVFKRGLIFAPLMYLFIYVTSRDDTTPVQQVIFTLQLLLIFLPFSYLMDVMTYRIWKRRAEKAGEQAVAKKR